MRTTHYYVEVYDAAMNGRVIVGADGRTLYWTDKAEAMARADAERNKSGVVRAMAVDVFLPYRP